MKKIKNNCCRHLFEIFIILIFMFVSFSDSISVLAKSNDKYISIKQNNGKILIKFLNLDNLDIDNDGIIELWVNIYDSNGLKLDCIYKKIKGKKLMITGLNSGIYRIELHTEGQLSFSKKVKVKTSINKDYKNIKIGDRIYFGTFEQDGNLDNGPEEIEWIVMSVEGNKALLYSSYVLYLESYNSYNVACTWETSSLRKWLNSEFYNVSFRKYEQKCIKQTLIHNENKDRFDNIDGGNDTMDKVFLPLENEYWNEDVDGIISDVINYIGPGIATKYAKTEWIYEGDLSYKGFYGFWLLGTSRESNLEAPNKNLIPKHREEIVHNSLSSFSRDNQDFRYATGGVRPAIYVDINKLKNIKNIKNEED